MQCTASSDSFVLVHFLFCILIFSLTVLHVIYCHIIIHVTHGDLLEVQRLHTVDYYGGRPFIELQRP